MKIGLIDVDGHNFPNLALMKISAYHRARGDRVSWAWSNVEHFDLVYKSRVFDDTYTTEDETAINADQVIAGGTGYGLDNRLPDCIEHQYPDYSIYPQHPEAYGFLTRGCPRNCPFCIVGQKEGLRSHQVADLSEFWRGQEKIKLLDPNLLASPDHEQLLQQLIASRAKVDFTQGLDARMVTADNAQLLRKVRAKRFHFAWDQEQDSDRVLAGLQQITHSGILPWRLSVYVLTNYDTNFAFDLHRVYTLRAMGMDPYVMIYDKPSAPQQVRDLQSWVNNRLIWSQCTRFEDYSRRKR